MADSNWLEKALHHVRERVLAVVPETGAELKRLGVQGSMELASALFNGHAFVSYGPGQYTPSPEQGPVSEHAQPDTQPPDHDQGRERGGMGR
ncbi:hypothetical protein [Fimbriiglobus ruber]|nr:hypothetical protein [Fimbriiglobus ruber]